MVAYSDFPSKRIIFSFFLLFSPLFTRHNMTTIVNHSCAHLWVTPIFIALIASSWHTLQIHATMCVASLNSQRYHGVNITYNGFYVWNILERVGRFFHKLKKSQPRFWQNGLPKESKHFQINGKRPAPQPSDVISLFKISK